MLEHLANLNSPSSTVSGVSVNTHKSTPAFLFSVVTSQYLLHAYLWLALMVASLGCIALFYSAGFNALSLFISVCWCVGIGFWQYKAWRQPIRQGYVCLEQGRLSWRDTQHSFEGIYSGQYVIWPYLLIIGFEQKDTAKQRYLLLMGDNIDHQLRRRLVVWLRLAPRKY